MLFRIVNPHLHRAVFGHRTFSCVREIGAPGDGTPIRWSAFDGKICLKTDCRTLNAAKKLCRIAASDRAVGNS